MEKENFEFYVDEPANVWHRYRFSVKATSLEEATALLTETFKRGGFDEIQNLDECNGYWDSEFLYDTMESTGKQVLYTEDGDFICEAE